MAVILLITPENGITIEIPLFNKCTLGRSTSCDVVLEDKQMSGKHGMFELNSNGLLFYSDLGSTNGSFLNNNQIHKIQFKLNETLKIGNTSVKIDEKRLNSREKASIGIGELVNDDKTIVLPSHKTDDEDSSKLKKPIVLKKNLKKKPEHLYLGASSKDTVIEQEASSGQTKFLKLDINKAKKNKK
jgi:pSer/pThr/pTyr-binding forkhead associated (FHA) protein